MASDTPSVSLIVAYPSSSTGNAPQDRRPQQDAERVADFRLVIEQGSRPGSFIYKTVNRITGEVIRQLPREDVARLATDSGYRSGLVADTTV